MALPSEERDLVRHCTLSPEDLDRLRDVRAPHNRLGPRAAALRHAPSGTDACAGRAAAGGHGRLGGASARGGRRCAIALVEPGADPTGTDRRYHDGARIHDARPRRSGGDDALADADGADRAPTAASDRDHPAGGVAAPAHPAAAAARDRAGRASRPRRRGPGDMACARRRSFGYAGRGARDAVQRRARSGRALPARLAAPVPDRAWRAA